MSKNEKTRSKVASPARKVVLQEKKTEDISKVGGVESWRHAWKTPGEWQNELPCAYWLHLELNKSIAFILDKR